MIERRKRNIYVVDERRKAKTIQEDEDNSLNLLNSFNTSMDDEIASPSIDITTPDPTPDFGGFGGGESGGGGASGDW